MTPKLIANFNKTLLNLKSILDEKVFCLKIKNLAHTLICQNIDELIFRGYKPEIYAKIIVIDRFNSCIINVSINFLGIKAKINLKIRRLFFGK